MRSAGTPNSIRPKRELTGNSWEGSKNSRCVHRDGAAGPLRTGGQRGHREPVVVVALVAADELSAAGGEDQAMVAVQAVELLGTVGQIGLGDGDQLGYPVHPVAALVVHDGDQLADPV